MKGLIGFVISLVFVAHLFYMFKGYQDNNSLVTKYRCTQLNQFSDIEKKLFLDKSHKIGCDI